MLTQLFRACLDFGNDARLPGISKTLHRLRLPCRMYVAPIYEIFEQKTHVKQFFIENLVEIEQRT